MIDRVAPLQPAKETHGLIRADPVREIAANEIYAPLGRTAPRDLVDLRVLLSGGLTLAAVLADAAKKNGAADPAMLAWVLSRYALPPTAPLPRSISRDDVDTFRRQLIDELLRLAIPVETR